jgi:hypothetical protein
MYTQRRLTQLIFIYLWQPVSVYPTIFRPLFYILKAHTIGKNARVTIKIQRHKISAPHCEKPVRLLSVTLQSCVTTFSAAGWLLLTAQCQSDYYILFLKES